MNPFPPALLSICLKVAAASAATAGEDEYLDAMAWTHSGRDRDWVGRPEVPVVVVMSGEAKP